MAWTIADLTWLGIDEAASGGDVITITIGTPLGQVQIMGEAAFEMRGSRSQLIVRRAHIHSDSGSNTIGVANLHTVAELILQKVDCDEARIEGAPRTSGANPGHTPRPLRYTRRGNFEGSV